MNWAVPRRTPSVPSAVGRCQTQWWTSSTANKLGILVGPQCMIHQFVWAELTHFFRVLFIRCPYSTIEAAAKLCHCFLARMRFYSQWQVSARIRPARPNLPDRFPARTAQTLDPRTGARVQSTRGTRLCQTKRTIYRKKQWRHEREFLLLFFSSKRAPRCRRSDRKKAANSELQFRFSLEHYTGENHRDAQWNFGKKRVLTVLVCSGVWTSGGCTVWNGTHGTPGPPGSHGTTASRPPDAAWIPCNLQATLEYVWQSTKKCSLPLLLFLTHETEWTIFSRAITTIRTNALMHCPETWERFPQCTLRNMFCFMTFHIPRMFVLVSTKFININFNLKAMRNFQAVFCFETLKKK